MADDTSEEGLLSTKQETDGERGVNDGFSEVSKSSENLDSLTEETNLLPGSSQETIPATSLLERVEHDEERDNSQGEIWLAIDCQETEEKRTEAEESTGNNTGQGARPKEKNAPAGGREVKFVEIPEHEKAENNEREANDGGDVSIKEESGRKTSKDDCSQQVKIGDSFVKIVESKTPYVDIPSDFDQMSHSSSVAGSLSKGITPSSVFVGMEECRTLPNLPKRPPLLLEFKELSYSVREGSFWHKNRGMAFFIHLIFISVS